MGLPLGWAEQEQSRSLGRGTTRAKAGGLVEGAAFSPTEGTHAGGVVEKTPSC